MSVVSLARVRRARISEFHANWLTHGLGLALAVVGAPLLVMLAMRVGRDVQVAACAVYGLTLILLFASSTHYHIRQDKPGDYWRLVADHLCIYLLIAGTFTPFCLAMLHGPLRWTLLGAVWALAAVGIGFTLVFGMRFPKLALGLYLAMGWISVISLSMLASRAGEDTWALLLAGGAFYTVGTLFYARVWIGKIRYAHAVWHIAVLGGSTLHYFAVRECLLSLARAAH